MTMSRRRARRAMINPKPLLSRLMTVLMIAAMGVAPGALNAAPGTPEQEKTAGGGLPEGAAETNGSPMTEGPYNISYGKLPNGLDVIVIENHALELATVNIAVRNGAFTEPPEFDGLSHLYEHMFFKGNAKIPTEEEFNKRRRELGARSNATTSNEVVQYFMTVHKKNLRPAAEMLRDSLLWPLFARDELRGEMPVVLGEFDRNEADPSFHLYREVAKKLWYEHWSRKNTLGDREVIFNVTRDQMKEIQDRYYVPNNTALIVAGDVYPEEVYDLAQQLFGEWERAPDPFELYPVPEHPPLRDDERLTIVGDVQTASISVAWHGPSTVENTDDTFAADVFSFALSQPDSKFQRNLVDTGLVDSVGLSYSSLAHTGPVYLSATTSPDRVEQAWEAIQAEIEKFDDPDYLTDEQIESAKNMLEIGEIYDREQTSDFVHSLAFWWSTSGLDYYMNYIENLRDVSREDLQRYVRNYIQDKPRVEGLLVGEDALEQLAFDDTAEVIRPETGSSVVALDQPQEETEPRTEEFEVDGLPVVLRQVPGSEIVVASMLFQGGVPFFRQDRAGLEMLLLEVMDKGSEHYTKEEVNRQLARTGAVLSTNSVHDYSSFTLKTLRRDLEQNFDIFADAIVNPLLDPTEVELARERRLTMIAATEESPDAYLSILASQNFFRGHPYEAPPMGTRETIVGVSAEDLKGLHEQTFNLSRMKLFVIGDLTKEQVTELVRQRLTELDEGQFDFTHPPHNVDGPPRLVIDERDLPTNYVFGAFQMPSLESEDYPAAAVATAILSDRLFEEIRSKRNLSYAPMALMSTRKSNYGVLYVTTVKPNVTLEIMHDEIDKMIEQGVPEEDVQAIVEETITSDLVGNQTLAGQIGRMIQYEVAGGGWPNAENAVERLREVTPADVQEAAEKYFRDFYFSAIGQKEAFDEALYTSR